MNLRRNQAKNIIKIKLDGSPIAKARPRFNSRGKTYDTQSKEKNFIKWNIMKQMSDHYSLKSIRNPVSLHMIFYTPIPKSWSKKRKDLILGKPDPTRPDLDNYVKFYCDAMNEIVYKDDNQITKILCEKMYSDKPCVEIMINELLEESMINEHAITVKESVELSDLNYMIRKANRLGLKNRELIRVFMQEDDEGKHYYFEVEGLKNGNGD